MKRHGKLGCVSRNSNHDHSDGTIDVTPGACRPLSSVAAARTFVMDIVRMSPRQVNPERGIGRRASVLVLGLGLSLVLIGSQLPTRVQAYFDETTASSPTVQPSPEGLSSGQAEQDQADAELKKSLYFHAPFDGGYDAKLAKHDRRLYTAPDLKRTESELGQGRSDVDLLVADGRHGDAVRFRGKNRKVLFYPGQNMDFKRQDWSGTVSVWLRLTPDEDLQTGYADPLQITDKAWNDASFFIDFDIDSPRTFRLGVFSEYKHWNPQDVAWDAWPVKDRPMIAVSKPAMTRDRWTHVAWTFSGINAADDTPSVCRLYIDGQQQGELKAPIHFEWNLDRTAIMLGLDYIGDLDELMLFDRALTAKEVGRLQTFFNE